MVHDIIIENKKMNRLNPLVFGYENCDKKHSYGPAIRTYWLFHYVVSGFGTFKTENKTYRVKPGEMFVISPYVESYYEADEKKPWSYIWIGFETDSDFPEKIGHVVHCPEAEDIFEKMKSCDEYSGRNEFLCARLWDLFALLMGKDDEENKDYVKFAVEYIKAEYMNDITVEQIAKELNLERTYFSMLFKRKTGVSPKQYIVEHRMNVAAMILEKGGASVAVAAHSVGYGDTFAFSKMFKKFFGISPKNYSLGRHGE